MIYSYMSISKSPIILQVWRNFRNLLGIYDELLTDLRIRRPNNKAVITRGIGKFGLSDPGHLII